MEETLGKRIVQHRKDMGLTQDQLAERLGVTAQAVSKWENDQSCPDINMLPKLAELFGTTTDALLGREPVHEGKIVTDQEQIVFPLIIFPSFSRSNAKADSVPLKAQDGDREEEKGPH